MSRSKLSFSLALLVFAHLLGACAPGESFLAVELATDLNAGVEFVGVRVRVERDGMLIGEVSELAALGDSFLAPTRVGLFEDLSLDTYSVRVQLADLVGGIVAERTTIVELREDLALTVVVGATCRGVECPGDADVPAENTCADGRCVDPRCSPEAPEFCRETCESAADCVSGPMGTCIAGTCLYPACNDGDPCTDDALVDGACLYTPNGCSPDEHALTVELATDLLAGTDFVGVTVRLERDGAVVDETSELAALGDSYLPPVRVGLFDRLEAGTYTVHVSLTAVTGGVVVRRTTVVDLDGDLTLSVAVGAACRAVTCPGGGDAPELTTCAGSTCVDPRCSAETPEYCTDFCMVDADCPGADGEVGTCIAGSCLFPLCDDGNACTDDRRVDGDCVFTPNTEPCDDGVFCNGLDTCGGGSCSAHGTPPCTADRCDEGTATCDTGCRTASDCPDEVIGDWSVCAGFDDSCDQAATRSRTHVTFTCTSGMCESATTTENGTCTRVTEGDSCGARTCGTYGACRYGECQTDGSQSRACWDRECRSGVCSNVNTVIQNRACGPRPSQDGQTCTDDWCQGACVSGTCGQLCDYCGGWCSGTGCFSGTC